MNKLNLKDEIIYNKEPDKLKLIEKLEALGYTFTSGCYHEWNSIQYCKSNDCFISCFNNIAEMNHKHVDWWYNKIHEYYLVNDNSNSDVNTHLDLQIKTLKN